MEDSLESVPQHKPRVCFGDVDARLCGPFPGQRVSKIKACVVASGLK